MGAEPPNTRDFAAVARERVQIRTAPDWIVPCLYDADFKEKIRGAVTHLLIEQQAHAELHQTYVRVAMRLESLQAVQDQSQWRLEFLPQTQSVTLHSIKVRRGSLETEHALLDRIQFLQRESGLEGLVIDGSVTLLLLLEDVLPGDVLEWSYTIASQPRLLPEYVTLFFAFPPGAQVGKHHFSVRHAEQRVLKWKSSSPDLAPTIAPEGADLRCFWLGEKFSSPELENCTPAWHIVFPWIQVSDCPDWQTVARSIHEAWKEDVAGDGLTKLTEEMKSVGPDLLVRINRAIELVQDGFRYLSVNVELGGHMPASAETVIRRRYGDCKDKAFLLVRLLRALGIPARPVLVNAVWRQSVASMLPSPAIFNHVVVEYQVENEKRWVDATSKRQGGGALQRSVSDFGLGLPIDTATTELAPVPKASLPSGVYEATESFLLDTAGSFSHLSIVVTAKGVYADSFRLELENDGADLFAKKRLQSCADRFSRAARVGQVEFRDDREHNQFVLAEVFEIVGFLKNDGAPGTCLFFIQSHATAGLILPSINPRHNPFGLPFPCNLVHTVEIDFMGLDAVAAPVFQANNEFFTFTRRSKAVRKFFRVTFSFNTLTDSVPPDKLQDHRKSVGPVWQASALQIRFPVGYSRMRKRSDFGALPRSTRTVSSGGPTLVQKIPPALVAAAGGPGVEIGSKTTVEKAPQAKEAKVTVEQHPFTDSADAAAANANLLGLRNPRGSRARKRRMNRKCVLSFFIFLGGISGFALAGLLIRTPGAGGVLALLVLSGMAAMVWSLVLAVLGLTECIGHPERHPRGKGVAVLTFVCFAGLFLLLIVAWGTKGVTAGAEGPSRIHRSSAELLKFDSLRFVFHSPGLPWDQIDARRYGPASAVAFARPDPMFFMVVATKLGPGFPDTRSGLVELSKAKAKRDSTLYHLLNESEVTRHGLVGWQTETEAAFQGHEYYLVHWILATNGFGYQLVTWGPPALASQVKVQADLLFSSFELTAPRD